MLNRRSFMKMRYASYGNLKNSNNNVDDLDLYRWLVKEEKELAEQFFEEYKERVGIKHLNSLSFRYFNIVWGGQFGKKVFSNYGYIILTHCNKDLLKFNIKFESDSEGRIVGIESIEIPLVYASDRICDLAKRLADVTSKDYLLVYEIVNEDESRFKDHINIFEH